MKIQNMSERLININKVFLLFVLTIMIVGIMIYQPTTAEAQYKQTYTQVFYDKKQLSLKEGLVLNDNGRIFLPVREIAEGMGGYVGWNNANKSVSISLNNKKVTLWIQKSDYIANEQWQKMSVQPFIYQNKTMIPVRFVAQGLDHQVHWEAKSHRVLISNDSTIMKQMIKKSQNSIDWLAKIIMAEAEGEPFKGQVAVGAVVMNRVDHPSFPHSIYNVIFDKYGEYYQFEPVMNGRIYEVEPEFTQYEAARQALAGIDPTHGTLFFHNPSISISSWMAEKKVSVQIGSHVFMY